MVTGAEGADLACKIARRYAHEVRGVASNEVLILGVSGNYHGLSSGVWSLADPNPARTGRHRLLLLPLIADSFLQPMDLIVSSTPTSTRPTATCYGTGCFLIWKSV